MNTDKEIKLILKNQKDRQTKLKKEGLRFPNRTACDGLHEKYKILKTLEIKKDLEYRDIYEIESMQNRLCLTSQVLDKTNIYRLLFDRFKKLETKYYKQKW